MKTIWYVLLIVTLVSVSALIILSRICYKKYINILNQYSKFNLLSEANAYQLATILVSTAQIPIKIEEVNSKSTNYYSSRYKVLKLSTSVKNSISIITLAKIAQEVGYAILDSKNQFLYKIKSKILPIANIMLMSFIPLFILSLAFSFSFDLDIVGIIIAIVSLVCLILPTLLYFITLPVINSASLEASICLDKCKFLIDEELYAIKNIMYANSNVHLFNIFVNSVFLITAPTRL